VNVFCINGDVIIVECSTNVVMRNANVVEIGSVKDRFCING